MNTTSAEGLPHLPRAIAWCQQDNPSAVDAFAWDGMDRDPNRHDYPLYTAAQMRAYGELCRRTSSPAEGRMGEDESAQRWFADVLASTGAVEPLTDEQQARLDARVFGTGLLIDGKRVAPENVQVITSPADSPATLGDYDWDAAHEALESMDDYARMDKGVNPYGPYAVLRDLLTKAKGWQEQALAKKPEGRAVDAFKTAAYIADEMQGWLDFNEQQHIAEGSVVDDDTKIICPPVWPHRGVVKAWVSALRQLTTTPEVGGGRGE